MPKKYLFVASDFVPFLYNKLVHILEINIFGRDYSNLINLFQRY